MIAGAKRSKQNKNRNVKVIKGQLFNNKNALQQ